MTPPAPMRDNGQPPMREKIRAAQVATLYRNVTVGVLVAAAAAVVLAFNMARLDPSATVRSAAWAASVCACALTHIRLASSWRRARTAEAQWRRWAAAFAAICLAEGIVWGWASLFLSGPDRFDLQLMVMLVCYGLAGGAISALGTHLPSLWSFFLPTTVPFAIVSTMHGDGLRLAMGLLAAVYVVGAGAMAVRIHAETGRNLRLRFEVDDLAQAVARQRDRAEAANLAKSRFLAAASHDLRQPVHALSLTVGALNEMAMPTEARALVHHVGQSIEALDGMFAALLDISRLDAAVVRPDLQAVALQPLVDRVCRDHAPEAAAKGVALRTVRTSLAVRSDPILLERILRNLVANAVRYTDRGTILVGCRRGAAVRLEVWDTGRGIPAAMHEQIFEEYVQIGNPERDRAAGLGLGLAIVRRLASLLGHALSVRSAVGAGSVFGLTLPRAAGAPAAEGRAPAPVVDAGRAFVIVVDDEPAILFAMSALLRAWGHEVVAAPSGDDMLARLAHCPVRPDLLICDYRLRDGEDGIATIQRLQSEYNDDLPALLITGDTAPERLIEAGASGLKLLHKPVEHARLREAVQAALARKLMAIPT